MSTSAKKLIMMALIAFAGIIGANIAANAQNCSCTIVNGCKVVTFYDSLDNPIGTDTICNGQGDGTFSNCAKEPPPPNAPLNETLPLQNITAQGQSPTLGTIVTQSDPSRPSTPATIKSNFPPRKFPATVRFSFYARTTVGGKVYCSRTPLVFFNGNVNSYRPFNNERFCLEQDVEFYLCNDPQQRRALVLRAGQSCVYLN